MKHLTTVSMLILSIVLFSNCSKKTAETFTPTETWHPTNEPSMGAADVPTVEKGIFWIGSSMNHSFSIEAGSISLADVYALNNKDELKKDASGNLMFYPTKSLSEIEFFKSEIGNLDYEEGYFYKVQGSKHYLGSKLWGVIVSKVIQKEKDNNYSKNEDYAVEDFTPTETWHPPVTTQSSGEVTTRKVEGNNSSTTRKEVSTTSKTEKKTIKRKKTNKRWQNSKTKSTGSQEEPKVMVSSDPPSILTGTFWIGSSRNHSFSTEVGAVRVADEYAINLNSVERNSKGEITRFYPTKNMEGLEFFYGEISNLDYQEGYYYKVEGSLHYLGKKLSGVSANKLLEKVKDKSYSSNNDEAVSTIDPTETWHPENEAAVGDKKVSKTKRTTKRWQTSKKKAKISLSPDVLDGIFWIGSSRNHSFSMKVGAVSVVNAYALNLSHVKRKRSGEIVGFYPTENMENFEFYKGEIENLDYELGNYYKVGGSLHYKDNKLVAVKVNQVFEKVADKNFTGNKEEGTPTFEPTETWHPPVDQNDESEVEWAVSKNPPKVILETFWINSTKNGVLRTKSGPMSYTNCFVVNSNPVLEEGPFGDPIFYNGDNSTIDFYCDGIGEFDYEEGYFYKVSAQSYKTENGEKGLHVYEVLDKIEDKDFIKVEEMILHIGPEKMKSLDFYGNEIECYQAQYDQYSRSVAWEPYCSGVIGFEPEPGFIYSIKIKRTYKSKREAEMVMDDFTPPRDELISVLKKRRG